MSEFEGLVTLGTPPDVEIANALKKIAGNTDHWSSGHRRLHVNVKANAEEKAETAAWLAEQEAGEKEAPSGVDG